MEKIVSLAFDLNVAKNEKDEIIYLDVIREIEEGDIQISKNIFKYIYEDLIYNIYKYTKGIDDVDIHDNNQFESKIFMDNMIIAKMINESLSVTTKKYINEKKKYNDILFKNISEGINRIIPDLESLEKSQFETYTFKLDVKISGTKIVGSKIDLFDSKNNSVSNYHCLIVLFFLYKYYEEYEEDMNVVYNMIVYVSDDTIETFNLFTGDLESLLNYKIEEDVESMLSIVLTDNYKINVLDSILYSFNHGYYGDNYKDSTSPINKYVN